jgi:oligopeptide/dipeptide ABC transporter ATP-binding protein
MTLLTVRDLAVSYGGSGRPLRAVDGVDLDIAPGTTVGLVGESGSGKSTLARALVGLLPVAGGTIALHGKDITSERARQARAFRRSVQIVFQDPYASLNPRLTVQELLNDALALRPDVSRRERRAEAARLLQSVELTATAAERFPFEFSGGQRQRIAIARALAVGPELLIADEITSALDVSVQASILNLLRESQQANGIAILFISHNLGVIRYLSDTTAVMHVGRIVEHVETNALFAAPRHPYTQALIDAIPALKGHPHERLRPIGEVVDPHHPPTGCRFHERCPIGPLVHPDRRICTQVDPEPRDDRGDHLAACHFPLEAPLVRQSAP